MNNISIIDSNCCGCHACEQRCPVHAISFHENEEGFLYPKVLDHCVDCGACLAVCPMHEAAKKVFPEKAYAAYAKDTGLLRKSSSGGVFAVLAEDRIAKSGVVFGCAEMRLGEVKHICVDSLEGVCLLQGSKYVQSDMRSVYGAVGEKLKEGKTVLFSGTPCQVAGLQKYIGENDRLYTVDIVCHGVPSPKMYNAFLQWFSEKRNAHIQKFIFRSKKKNGWSLTYRCEMKRGRRQMAEERVASLSPYYHHFLQGYNYRESCYECKYACPERVSDITIADFWGIESVLEKLLNYYGTSAVLVHTEKGKQMWEAVCGSLEYAPVEVRQVTAGNGQLNAPSERPRERDSIYLEMNEKGYDCIAEKYRDLREEKIDGLKDIIPNRLRFTIKKIIRKVKH